MNQETSFQSLVEALDTEITLLRQLRELGEQAYGPLLRLEVAAVEAWVADQASLLRRIADAAAVRADLQEACLPPRARGIAGGGGLATTVTLHALVARAPREHAAQLRQQRDALRQLRDEIAVVSARNEALIGQVLSFTDHLGDGLAASTRTRGYDASGRQDDASLSGELFTGAI
jgi:hypothetical protein